MLLALVCVLFSPFIDELGGGHCEHRQHSDEREDAFWLVNVLVGASATTWLGLAHDDASLSQLRVARWL